MDEEQQGAGAPAGELAGVLLTGGSAARLGGADKASIELGGHTLLEHALDALVDARDVVVVGPEVPTSRPVTFVREDPPGGGPAAGLLAGLRALPRPPRWICALAVDMPLVTSRTLRRLREAAGTAGAEDGAFLVDENDRTQYLCAIYTLAALERNRPPYEAEQGFPMGMLARDLAMARVPAIGPEGRDLDSWQDLLEFRELLGR